jgi:hypothetical protein
MRNNITHTFIFSITDDFTHYIKNIPKTESSAETIIRIKNLVLKLSNKSEPEDVIDGRKTRYVIVITSKTGSLIIKYTNIENYNSLFTRNILHLQHSKMKIDDDRKEEQLLA